MAFDAKGLTRTRNGGTSVAGISVSEFSYATEDAAAIVEGANYFPGSCGLAKGDKVSAHMALGGTPILKHYMVTAVVPAGCTIVIQTVTAG
jgi:hypothetical protein